jgi:hypothetical protein
MPRRDTARNRRRPQALRRHRAAALIAAAAALTALGADAPAKPKPPPPNPKITLLTGTEQGVLRRESIKVEVRSARGRETKVVINAVVDGYPEDYPFRLGPEKRKLKGNDTTLRFKLSPRQLELLDFAIKSCRGTSLAIHAEVGRGSSTLSTGLRRPREC